MDHVVDVSGLAQRFGVAVVGSELTKQAGVPIDETFSDGDVVRSGGLEIQAIATPGHCPDHTALLVNGTDCLTADCLFKGTVGGTMGGGPSGYADQYDSIMNRLMGLPHETRIHPGHTLPSTIGDEWEHNPFIRIWRGEDPEGTEQCSVRGERSDADPLRRPTTTAPTRRGCATRTAGTRSSAGARSNEREARVSLRARARAAGLRAT